ncbi:MAG: FmdE family protein [Chloroflexota bacterium]
MTFPDHETVQLSEVECQPDLLPLFEQSSAKHRHLCPRQIIGVRLGLAGAAALGMAVPRRDKRMLVIVETDGCFISGVEAATGCFPNRRTLRIVDYGRVAATFINVKTEEAVRVAPQTDIRQKAWDYAKPGERRRYFAMLTGYQVMPTAEMLSVERVRLTTAVRELISRPGVRVDCEQCGEEIINEREMIVGGKTVCRACGMPAYYELF